MPIRLLLLSVLALAALLPSHAAQEGPAAAPSSIAWSDTSGRRYGPEEIQQAKATVFFFSSSQCPVAARYSSRLAQFVRDYAPRGVRAFLVSANPTDRAAWAGWAAAHGFPGPAVFDEGAALADRLGATATPEAALVDSTGAVRYLGRIDDSTEREKVTRSYLKEALEAVLAGQPVKNARVLAVGCRIFREEIPAAAPAPGAVTYARDIAPLLNKHCVACHRAGDVAPFALTRYEEARPWAAAIKSYTARRLMPPWKASPGHGEFLDARWLSAAELAKVAAWADSGAPLGDPKDLPKPPALRPAGTWALGQPDAVLKPARPFHLEADGRDVYRNFTLPIDFAQDRYVAAFDFLPGNRGIVHHIIAYIDLDGRTAARMDNRESEPGWSVAGGGSGIVSEDWGEGWAPGMTPRRQPPGVAIRIPRGAKLVLQVHYHKSGKPEEDQSALAVYWAKGPIRQVRRVFPFGQVFFRLLPGVADQKVEARLTVPRDITLREILPHMHMLGKEMKVTATLPDGTEKPLIYVKGWDFNWQMIYRYREPVRLPRGTKLHLVALYDNTTRNPNQPSNPPRLVRFGEQTNDEMCFAFLAYTRDEETAGGPP